MQGLFIAATTTSLNFEPLRAHYPDSFCTLLRYSHPLNDCPDDSPMQTAPFFCPLVSSMLHPELAMRTSLSAFTSAINMMVVSYNWDENWRKDAAGFAMG